VVSRGRARRQFALLGRFERDTQLRTRGLGKVLTQRIFGSKPAGVGRVEGSSPMSASPSLTAGGTPFALHQPLPEDGENAEKVRGGEFAF